MTVVIGELSVILVIVVIGRAYCSYCDYVGREILL